MLIHSQHSLNYCSHVQSTWLSNHYILIVQSQYIFFIFCSFTVSYLYFLFWINANYFSNARFQNSHREFLYSNLYNNNHCLYSISQCSMVLNPKPHCVWNLDHIIEWVGTFICKRKLGVNKVLLPPGTMPPSLCPLS